MAFDANKKLGGRDTITKKLGDTILFSKTFGKLNILSTTRKKVGAMAPLCQRPCHEVTNKTFITFPFDIMRKANHCRLCYCVMIILKEQVKIIRTL